MVVKKKSNNSAGLGYLIVSLCIILLILFLLYRLYYHLHRQAGSQKPKVEKIAKNEAESLLQLQNLWRRNDFSWPIAEGGIAELNLVQHTAFSLGYSEEHEQSAWVSYMLSRVHAKNAHDRKNNFRSDPGIPTQTASPRDYTNSGYDRGHLAPAADFDYNRKALSETFFMSNISPQRPELNRGKWKELEELARDWATQYDSLWIVTGPVLEKGLKKIGTNKVSVPKYFYKIILDPKQPDPKMIGFILPNVKHYSDLRNYAVPVDSIEKVCRLDFFPQLPDLLEERLESEVHLDVWLKLQ